MTRGGSARPLGVWGGAGALAAGGETLGQMGQRSHCKAPVTAFLSSAPTWMIYEWLGHRTRRKETPSPYIPEGGQVTAWSSVRLPRLNLAPTTCLLLGLRRTTQVRFCHM